MTTMTATEKYQAYRAAFEVAKSESDYPAVSEFEARMGCAVAPDRLEAAALVLACPLKANPPHWQHGRVLYAAARRYLSDLADTSWVNLLDIGTAKGFSALCLQWALMDSGKTGQVVSVDVIDPGARVARNTIAEFDGPLTLRETLLEWPESRDIHFAKATGVEWLIAHREPIRVAFIDGKHTGEVVRQEGKLLSQRQRIGDLAIFDDVQIPGVSVAVVSLEEWYRMEYLQAGPREYAIGRRR